MKKRIYFDETFEYSYGFANIDWNNKDNKAVVSYSNPNMKTETYNSIDEATAVLEKNGYAKTAQYSEGTIDGRVYKRFMGKTDKGHWVKWHYFATVTTEFKSGMKNSKKFKSLEEANDLLELRASQDNVKSAYILEGFEFDEPKRIVDGVMRFGTSHTTMITDLHNPDYIINNG